MPPTELTEQSSAPTEQKIGNQPAGLYTLFFTEMWERFSYYGMRALLVLFMVDSVRGGMGLSDELATSIYGLYTAAVYLASLPGGWLSDRLLGPRRTIWYGGLIIALGHFTLALPQTQTFYLGLVFVVIGSGMLKPNMSALVGELYPEGGARRDAGFTIFYMGINLGAALGPLVCSTLGEKRNWHMGFAAAGFGMLAGLAQFHFSRKFLGNAGRRPSVEKPLSKTNLWILVGLLAGGILLIVLVLTGVIAIQPIALARKMAGVIVIIGILYFGVLLFFAGLETVERKRLFVIMVLFVSAAVFWAGFEQAGSTLNLFAERYTNRWIPTFNYEVPAGWFQSLGAIFIILFAPGVAWFWVWLGRRNLNQSTPMKFALGLFLLAGGFLVMWLAAKVIVVNGRATPVWLILTYLLHTFGELCLSPVGLSSVTKLAPRRLVGQMMGTWFLATSLGNLLAGLIAGQFKADAVTQMPLMFLKISIIPVAVGLGLIVLSRKIKVWMVGIR